MHGSNNSLPKMSLFLLIILSAFILESSGANSVHDYLGEQLKQSKVEIAKIHIQDDPPVEVKSYKLQSEKLWSETLSSEQVFLAKTQDKVLVIESGRILIHEGDVAPSNGTSGLREIARIPGDNAIKFTRSYVWKSVLYLLVCHVTGSCSLYTANAGSPREFRHRQTIRQRGIPVDASFFTRENQLYLVLADNSREFSAPSVIYDWRGTYMDMVTEMFTSAAVSVASFRHKQSTILVFAQSDEKNPRVGSLVYEFRDNNAQRIQFLSTVAPSKVHHYNYAGFDFVLLANRGSPGELFWWDGQELLRWMTLPEIEASAFSGIERIKGETYLFVGQNNVLKLYKVESTQDCTLVGSLKLDSAGKMVDMKIEANESTIKAILILKNEKEYSLESWDLLIEEASHGSRSLEKDAASKCLAELIEILSQRMPSVQRASSSWPSLYSSTENLTISAPIILPSLDLKSGSIDSINLLTSQEIIAPMRIEDKIRQLAEEVEDVLAGSRQLPASNRTNSFVGNIVVRGDVFFRELQVDHLDVDFWNDVDLRRNSSLSTRSLEKSDRPLRGKSIVVQDLEVDSLCGIPSEFWARKNDSSRITLNTTSTAVEFFNDTILLHSDIVLPELRIKTLNNVDVEEFLDDVFIYGTSQVIDGNVTYTNSLRVTNLSTQFFNEFPADNLLDKSSEQSFHEFFIKTIKIDKLYADSVNGVAVNDSALVSQENVIKGDLTLAKLQVTEELIIDFETESEEVEYRQVYKNVTIDGNLRVKSIVLKNPAVTLINNEKINLNEIFKTYWTKSSDQVIEDKVRFTNNLIIDQLDAEYINGLSRDEFLFTSLKEVPHTVNLHIDQLRVDDSFLLETDNSSLIEFTDDSVTFRNQWHVNRLRVNDLFIDAYNGVPINRILNNETKVVFTNTSDYSIIKAKRVKVVELNYDLLNNERLPQDNHQSTNEIRRIEFVKVPELQIEELNAETINKLDAKKFDGFRAEVDQQFKRLIIEGDLVVNNDLQVGQVEDRSVESYFEELVREDLVVSSEELLDNLTVDTATLNLLHGRNVTSFFQDLLTRSREQFVPGNISFHRITTNNTNTDYINGEKTAGLIWIDKPITILGNVTFDELIVEGDVITKELNGRNPEELYESLLEIPIKRVSFLKVDGQINWGNSSMVANTVSYLLENAVTKDANQMIDGDVTFEEEVSVSVFNGHLEEENEIREVLLDAVIDDGEVRITGKKIFKKNLILNELSVADYVNISSINDVDIIDFNSSIIRKYEENEISNHITFLDDVIINQLQLIDDRLHGVDLNKIALQTDTLANVAFKNLKVLHNVYVKNVDGVDLDKFLNRRITLSGNHTILSDVQFSGSVEVTGNAEVSKINGINPADFVLNEVEETQFISGSKTFQDDLIVTGNVRAPFINDVDAMSEYKTGVQRDDDVEIYGDLIFKGKVNAANISVSQFFNGVNLQYLFNNSVNQVPLDLNVTQQTQNVEKSIRDLYDVASTLRNKFMYLEEDDSLKIRLPNVKKVEPVYYQGVVKLNIFAEEPGNSCGLPASCSCPSGYSAEYAQDDCNVKKINDSVRIWYFHEPHAGIGFEIRSNTVSYTPECTLEKEREEFTRISWMRVEVSSTGDVTGIGQDMPVKIPGFVKDAHLFTFNNEAYIVLAIYYDPMIKSHRVKSPIYKLNLETNSLTLHQELSTDGAWDIELFNIESDLYLIIACSGASSRSYLYRFDPKTSQFSFLRTFGGQSRHVKTVSLEKNHFIFLEDFNTNSVKVFSYKPQTMSFQSYQNLFYDSSVSGIESFYADVIGHSDSFVIVSTQSGEFFLYEYMFAQGFQVIVKSWIDGAQAMVPFHYLGHRYLFVGSVNNSTILRIVQEGPHP